MDSLAQALTAHGIDLPDSQVEQLDRYCTLLWEWNEKINLTRHTDYERFVSRDVIDSMQLANLLHEGEEVLDVGTGGGVPGVILAILRPDLTVSLCEAVGKKGRAVQDMLKRLELPVAFFQGRSEQVLEDMRFDAVVARAIGPLWKMLTWFQSHWLSIGRLLAIKGPKWNEERTEARNKGLLEKLELRKAVSYPMPGTESESVILKIWPKNMPER